MTTLNAIPEIADITQPELAQVLQHALDNKTKPVGSLGRIETLAQRIGLILGTASPELQAPQMLVCAADHGLAARGVSAYPSDVTWQMVENFLAGGAAVSVLARQHGIGLTVVDCGVRHDFSTPVGDQALDGQPAQEATGMGAPPERKGLLIRKIAHGTADALEGPAMSAAQCAQAVANGRDVVRGLPGNALLLGEMGIGNTSAASMLLARLAGLAIGDVTGAGTGLDADAVVRKIGILRDVLARHADAKTPLDALAAFGGFEIATLVGAVLQAAEERRVIVVDGFIATSAVLVASHLQPHVLQRCVFAHRSGERGHALMLAHLRADPLLDLGLRLGEGSGAALAWPLLLSACALLREMASFEAAGVSRDTANSRLPPLGEGGDGGTRADQTASSEPPPQPSHRG
ncbi:nicotinate-nucleotide--dimethylbenzimidazole phosphoribosyltransferase [Hydrogenophaga sp.]|uniref:nicotinate-nucleotide--dimethylbenzimidazole phosphoribosyltransferase n=1 Tax=Hydrogenophaga sp. TaxID=1904254 RepID=UPI002719BCD9|nr:nicotinate-nucleotide--dimethylbenzimidazole phosphoribosyltransferase [Hydrogenophaga sp.]MDO9436599.1 nicotinate-nucleotide--dimethylbenzimidazole phosphoribosyltransferase [Hydrogenophaga sp.]